MLFDKIINLFVNMITYAINLMPSLPNIDQASNSFSTLFSFLNSNFIPTADILTAFTLVLLVWGADRTIKLIKFVLNLIRGAGA